MKRVYLDYAATTPVRPEVVKAMAPYWTERFGNPSSLHSFGQEARKVVDESREIIAGVLNCSPKEILFTGTTTTSDNLAILGVIRALKGRVNRPHVITCQIEHHSVLDTFKFLEKEGVEVTYLPVDKDGLVDLEALEKSLKKETILVSIIYANNEVGTIEPLEEISKIIHRSPVADHPARHASPAGQGLPARLPSEARRPGALSGWQGEAGRQSPFFHTDAAAVAEYLSLDVQKLGVDLLTLGSHKFGGPKGVGILFLKKGVPIKPITFGGHHEFGLWPGTEAVPLIVGMAEALKLAIGDQLSVIRRVTKLQDRLIEGVLKEIPETILTGHPQKRLPDIASFCFKGAEGEAILLRLDQEGIAASSGSACTSGSLQPSHVLLAMGIPAEIAHGSIRFSLGRGTTKEEIDYVLEKLPGIIKGLREMAPKF